MFEPTEPYPLVRTYKHSMPQELARILAAIALVSCAKDVENCDFPEGRVISNCKLPRIAP